MTIVFRNQERMASKRWLRLPTTAGGAFLLLFWTWWALLGLFATFPQIDIFVSRHFFLTSACPPSASLDQVCGVFPYSSQPIFVLIRKIFFELPNVTALLLLWMLFVCYQQHGATFNPIRARNLKVALAALIIGPGIISNIILKQYSGRPRPYETDIFGGHLHFVPAGSFAGKCLSNCSFISGEAASAGWLFCLILILPQPARSALALPLAAISLLMPALRVSFGGHYLSDVVLGWLSSLVVFVALLSLSQRSHPRKKSGI